MADTTDSPRDGPDDSVCLYRRAGAAAWWRVDASITPAGDIAIVSGDGNEWHAIVRGDAREALLRALRRTGDLVAGIGASREQEILARLRERFHRDDSHACGPFEEIKAFLSENGVEWEARFWADADAQGSGAGKRENLGELAAVLAAARALLALPRNDFTWSSWKDGDAALEEIDGLIAETAAGRMPDRATLDLLFAPAGPMQEVSLASGWARAFTDLAAAFDRAVKGGS